MFWLMKYQDTNRLQSSILLNMRPDGRGMAVVGDDSAGDLFLPRRAVRSIACGVSRSVQTPALDVAHGAGTARCTQPILDASNAVIGLAKERYSKQL